MATKKNAESVEATMERTEESGAIPELIQALEKRLEKIEKRENKFTDSKAFVNRGAHPNQIP